MNESELMYLQEVLGVREFLAEPAAAPNFTPFAFVSSEDVAAAGHELLNKMAQALGLAGFEVFEQQVPQDKNPISILFFGESTTAIVHSDILFAPPLSALLGSDPETFQRKKDLWQRLKVWRMQQ